MLEGTNSESNFFRAEKHSGGIECVVVFKDLT